MDVGNVPSSSPVAPSQEQGLQAISSLGIESINRAKDERAKRRKASRWLLAIGLFLTVLVATLGVLWPDFGAVEAVGLSVLAGFFQIQSVIVASHNAPSESDVRTQLINGWQLFQRLEIMRTKTEKVYETGNTESRRRMLGETSAAFTHLQDSATISFHGWASIYPHLINDHPNQNDPDGRKRTNNG